MPNTQEQVVHVSERMLTEAVDGRVPKPAQPAQMPELDVESSTNEDFRRAVMALIGVAKEVGLCSSQQQQ